MLRLFSGSYGIERKKSSHEEFLLRLSYAVITELIRGDHGAGTR